VHVRPSPANPALQRQAQPSAESVQTASPSHGSPRAAHSSVGAVVQVPLVALQTGPKRLPAQSTSEEHGTQMFAAVLQVGSEADTQCALKRQAPQEPAVEQYARLMDENREHCESDVHAAQEFVEVLQTGAAAVHKAGFVAEHCPQAPVPRQTGSALVGHARVDAEPLSPLHPTQKCVAVLQKGVVPVQAEAFAGEHWRQLPLTQAGPSTLPAHWLSDVQVSASAEADVASNVDRTIRNDSSGWAISGLADRGPIPLV
jgi:hypothetical protein